MRENAPYFAQNEANSELLAEFLSEIWWILTIFMSFTNTFTVSQPVKVIIVKNATANQASPSELFPLRNVLEITCRLA